MVVGQIRHKVHTGFSHKQSFRGRVSLLLLWPRLLTTNEMGHVDSCRHPPPAGAILPWATPPWQPCGHTQVVTSSHCDQLPWTVFKFTEPRTYKLAVAYLHILGMELPVASSPAKMNLMRKLLGTLPHQCAYYQRKFMFINAIYDSANNSLIDPITNWTINLTVVNTSLKGRSVPFLREVDTVGLTLPTTEACYLGEYPGNPAVFQLRGFSLDDFVSNLNFTFILSSRPNEGNYFAGFYGLTIKSRCSRWNLIHSSQNRTLASVQSRTLPVGRREWCIAENSESCLDGNRVKNLTLSICHDHQFTCTDGNCVNMTARCDLNSDCPDWSDEQKCKTLRLPDGYLPHLPPEPPVDFNLSIAFNNMEVNLLKMTVFVELHYQLTWYDARISFLNLREGSSSNRLHRDNIWMPQVQMRPIVDRGTFDNPSVFVTKRTQGARSQGDTDSKY